jgi:hypothetical protein
VGAGDARVAAVLWFDHLLRQAGRYDAAHTVQSFSARRRQQIDLDTLTAELRSVVDQTMQPTSVSL